MSETNIIELLVNQRESALDIWKNLLTVALAIIAYYGALNNKVSKPVTTAIIFLFTLFAFSNARALVINIATREKLNSMLCSINDHSPMINVFIPSEIWQYASYGFHAIIDLTVIALIIYMSGIYNPNNAFNTDAKKDSRPLT